MQHFECWFCILHLYCINLFLLCGVFRIFYIKTMSSEKEDSFTSSFLDCIQFIYFSCLATLVRTRSTNCTEWKRKEWPYLPSSWPQRKSSQCFTTECVSCGLFIHGLYYVGVLSSIPNLLTVFIIQKCWILSRAFSASVDRREWLCLSCW